MMESYAGAAKMEGALNLTYSYGATVFEKKPIDSPSFASQRIFKLCLVIPSQPSEPSKDKQRCGRHISPIVRTELFI
jgi:hypothetical protein